MYEVFSHGKPPPRPSSQTHSPVPFPRSRFTLHPSQQPMHHDTERTRPTQFRSPISCPISTANARVHLPIGRRSQTGQVRWPYLGTIWGSQAPGQTRIGAAPRAAFYVTKRCIGSRRAGRRTGRLRKGAGNCGEQRQTPRLKPTVCGSLRGRPTDGSERGHVTR